MWVCCVLQKEPELVFCERGHGCYIGGGGRPGGRRQQCQGHVPRKFIWECNSTCGCHMSCPNRVVQRGMKVKVGVFWTGVRGWGVRTFESIPVGTFVFEYVGEVVNNAELLKRNEKSHVHGDYTLDLNADWKTEAGVSDANALCIDGLAYGNVGRFVNHRCSDANLIDFPVKIEESDPHIYHVAFFAKRNICTLEELTWVRIDGLHCKFHYCLLCWFLNIKLILICGCGEMYQDYGTSFWEESGGLSCACGSLLCRGRWLGNNSRTGKVRS